MHAALHAAASIHEPAPTHLHAHACTSVGSGMQPRCIHACDACAARCAGGAGRRVGQTPACHTCPIVGSGTQPGCIYACDACAARRTGRAGRRMGAVPAGWTGRGAARSGCAAGGRGRGGQPAAAPAAGGGAHRRPLTVWNLACVSKHSCCFAPLLGRKDDPSQRAS